MACSGKHGAEALSDHTTRRYQNRQSPLGEYSQLAGVTAAHRWRHGHDEREKLHAGRILPDQGLLSSAFQRVFFVNTGIHVVVNLPLQSAADSY